MDADQDILGFDITMDDMLFMQVYESGRHLSNIFSSPRLREAPSFLQHLVELTLSREFQDEKHALRIVEVAV